MAGFPPILWKPHKEDTNMDNRFIPCGQDAAITGKDYSRRNALPYSGAGMNREARRKAAKLAKKARKNGGRI